MVSLEDTSRFTRPDTYLFFTWFDPPGSALRFLEPASGTGVSRGLLGLGLAAFEPKTLLIARSMGALPFVVFSTFLRFAGGLPLTVAVLEIPRPTAAGESAGGFRDLGPPAFLPGSPLCLVS